MNERKLIGKWVSVLAWRLSFHILQIYIFIIFNCAGYKKKIEVGFPFIWRKIHLIPLKTKLFCFISILQVAFGKEVFRLEWMFWYTDVCSVGITSHWSEMTRVHSRWYLNMDVGPYTKESWIFFIEYHFNFFFQLYLVWIILWTNRNS